MGGVQTALNSFFNCAYITLTLILPNVEQFGILIGVSCVACIGSALIYIAWFISCRHPGQTESEGSPEDGRAVENKSASLEVGRVVENRSATDGEKGQETSEADKESEIKTKVEDG